MRSSHREGLFFLGWVTLLVACGGSESTQFGKSDGGGGTKTDASTGATGGIGTGGSSATGASGGTPSGGSGGIGAGGDGGIPSGGSAGVSSGGSPSGGAAGVGGNDGGTTTSRCDPLCNRLVGAACSSGPTLAGCLLTCKVLTSSASCDPTANAYFDCAEATTIACNAAGDPVAKGCGVKYVAAIGCAVTANPNPAVEQPCSNYCNKVVAAKCPNNGTLNECQTNCKWLGATGTGCDDEWLGYLNCANALSSFSCLLGYAVAPGCGPKFTAYTRCINQASQP